MSDISALSKSCPKCGAVLASEATDGLCPQCLMNEVMEPTIVSDASKPKDSAVLTPEELAPFFPQYEILRMLGRGGMGAVYLARQISLKRLVAIKLLPTDMSDSEQGFSERFKNEAQAMAQLNHPGIVAVYDFGQTANGLLYIVMEYVEGTDVQLMLASQGRLHSAHAMAITAHVCDALQYAHTRGIIHRDIKPSNIMVSNDGVVKVADFGLAKMSHGQTTGLTQSGMAMGTLHFMAPEALTLGTAVDQRADIYAVGVMLYQMLTGKLPQGMFEMPSLQVAGLDPRYDRIVARALRDDRELRYQAALELRHDLDAILTQPVEKVVPEAEEEVKALPPVEARGKKKARVPSPASSQAASSAPAKKKPVGLILTMVGVAAALVAVFVYWNGSGGGHFVSAPTLATKEHPFVNSLGMKFVPVPGTKILLCIHETRKSDYAAFAAENANVDDMWLNHFNQGIPVGNKDDHPVVCVSWNDSQAFCAWLSKKEGRIYRLPTDREWSCAVGIGEQEQLDATPEVLGNRNRGVFPWGLQWPPPKGAGNFADMSTKEKMPSFKIIEGYADGYPTTAPVQSFQPNLLGFYDLAGSVEEWCEDWYNSTKKERVERGQAWAHFSPDGLKSSFRSHRPPDYRFDGGGFRCALVVGDASKSMAERSALDASQAASSQSATVTGAKDAPFVNSLGMKFVPVPITGGPTNGQRVHFSVWETRVQDYEVFAQETKREWKQPSFQQGPSHPAVNLTYFDAKNFCEWLTEHERKAGRLIQEERYRLPTDHEWSCAAAIGTREDGGKSPKEKHQKTGNVFPWGASWPPPSGAGNYSGEEVIGHEINRTSQKVLAGYRDDFVATAPVGSFAANTFGLFDLGGNAWELCRDLFDPTTMDCTLRGGSWINDDRSSLLLSYRNHNTKTYASDTHGFRCVLDSSTQTASSGSGIPDSKSLPAITPKDAPFISTLGMKCIHVSDETSSGNVEVQNGDVLLTNISLMRYRLIPKTEAPRTDK
jgi:serine/threonine protein kinase